MSSIKTINPKEVSVSAFHTYMLGVIAPRPIAFASTIDKQGNINLSPFSFFNAFGSNPPLVVFSPARRVRDNTIKHTLENVYEVDEVVINIVNYAIVQQMSLASCEYDKGINEFTKAGFTQVDSTCVKPPRVGEAPAAFECKVKQIIETGTAGGAANLVICEIILAHIKEEILDANGRIDPQKLDAVARMGGDWYCRAQGEAIFEVPKPNQKKGIGVDQIPRHVRFSHILSGNDLGMLGNVEILPDADAIQNFSKQANIQALLKPPTTIAIQDSLHRLAKRYLAEGKVQEAWLTLLQQ